MAVMLFSDTSKYNIFIFLSFFFSLNITSTNSHQLVMDVRNISLIIESIICRGYSFNHCLISWHFYKWSCLSTRRERHMPVKINSVCLCIYSRMKEGPKSLGIPLCHRCQGLFAKSRSFSPHCFTKKLVENRSVFI